MAGPAKKFHITTFGCQMNEHDSETIAGMLTDMGYEEAFDRDDAGLVIINTCSVRENADKRFFGTLGQLKNRHEEEPGLIVAVCGCMMQQKKVVDTIDEKFPWVDIVFGTNNIHRLPDLLKDIEEKREREDISQEREVWDEASEIVEGLPSKRLYRHKALVNIMYGCDNFCTYCIVPYVRGRERSRDADEVIKEISSLASDGVREVMLLGQNVNSYRGSGGETFSELISRVSDVEGIDRIRFMTSHPKDLSPELIEEFRVDPKLCKNIHLPVQAGSDAVLKRMNRKYTRDEYMDLVKRLRDAVPEITISTDIIVGFPGETEEDFDDTLDLVEKVGYDSAFTFIYSKRAGTPAENFDDQVPLDVAHERFGRLVDLVDSISLAKNREYTGRIERVLVEGKSKRNSNALSGRTDGFKLVNFEGDHGLIGRFVDVEITEAKTFSLEGKIVEV